MKLSARNQIPGKVVAITKGQIMAKVKIDIGSGNVLTSTITVEAVDDLGIKEGDSATAIIKASSIMIGK